MITPYERILRMYMNGQHEAALTDAYALMDTTSHSTQPAADDDPIERAAFLMLVGSVCHRAHMLANARDFYRGVLRELDGCPQHEMAVCARFNLASAVAPCDLAEARALHRQVCGAASSSNPALARGLQIQRQRLFGP